MTDQDHAEPGRTSALPERRRPIERLCLAVAAAAALALSACGDIREVQTLGPEAASSLAEPLPPVVDTHWVAQEIDGWSLFDGSRITLLFDTGSKVGGTAGCNGYSANYRLVGDELTLYPPFIGTKVACPVEIMQQEARFLELLSEAERATVRNDRSLMIETTEGRILRFKAKDEEAAKVEGSDDAARRLDLLCGGERFALSLREDMAELTLAEGGSVSLPRLSRDDANSAEGTADERLYTDGRMTLLERGGAGEGELLFARGRMAFQSCERV